MATFPWLLSFVNSLVRFVSSCEMPGWMAKGSVQCVTTARSADRKTRKDVRRHDLDRSHASMNKPNKKLAENRARPHRSVPALGNGRRHCPVVVAPEPRADRRLPLEGVSRMEDVAEDSVGVGAEGDRQAEEPVYDPGSAS